jgi:uncharacterized protein YtpQ (UPF0354 family)
MTRVLAALVCLALCVSGAAAELLSRRAFAERMAQAFRAAVPAATVRILDENEIEFLAGDGVRRVLVLKNAYALHQGDPQRPDDVIQLYVTATLDRLKGPQPKAAGLDRSRIIPVIKDRQWLADNYRGFKERGVSGEFLVEDFNKELVIVYAEDSDKRTRYLMSSEQVGDRKDLRRLAIDNLERLLPNAQLANHGDLFTMITAGGDYEASLLLFDSIWNTGKIGGQIDVQGDIVVAVPAKDVLLVTGSRNRNGLKAVREMVAKAVQGPYRLTDTLFVYRDGRFEKFGR